MTHLVNAQHAAADARRPHLQTAMQFVAEIYDRLRKLIRFVEKDVPKIP